MVLRAGHRGVAGRAAAGRGGTRGRSGTGGGAGWRSCTSTASPCQVPAESPPPTPTRSKRPDPLSEARAARGRFKGSAARLFAGGRRDIIRSVSGPFPALAPAPPPLSDSAAACPAPPLRPSRTPSRPHPCSRPPPCPPRSPCPPTSFPAHTRLSPTTSPSERPPPLLSIPPPPRCPGPPVHFHLPPPPSRTLLPPAHASTPMGPMRPPARARARTHGLSLSLSLSLSVCLSLSLSHTHTHAHTHSGAGASRGRHRGGDAPDRRGVRLCGSGQLQAIQIVLKFRLSRQFISPPPPTPSSCSPSPSSSFARAHAHTHAQGRWLPRLSAEGGPLPRNAIIPPGRPSRRWALTFAEEWV